MEYIRPFLGIIALSMLSACLLVYTGPWYALLVILGMVVVLGLTFYPTHARQLGNALALLTLILTTTASYLLTTGLLDASPGVGLLIGGVASGLVLMASMNLLNWLLFIPPHTHAIIRGPFGKRECWGPARVLPLFSNEALVFVARRAMQRCDFRLENINVQQRVTPVMNLNHTQNSNWDTGPPTIGYDFSDHSVREITGDVQFWPQPDAAAKRYNIAGYDDYRTQMQQKYGLAMRKNIPVHIEATLEIYRLAIREKLDELVRSLLISEPGISATDVRNYPQKYARRILRTLRDWGHSCGIEIHNLEFRAVKLVDAEVEEAYRQAQVLAYSQAQAIRLTGDALGSQMSMAVQHMIRVLEEQNVKVSPQLIAAVAKDAMREAFFLHHGRHANHFNVVNLDEKVPSESENIIEGGFRKAS